MRWRRASRGFRASVPRAALDPAGLSGAGGAGRCGESEGDRLVAPWVAAVGTEVGRAIEREVRELAEELARVRAAMEGEGGRRTAEGAAMAAMKEVRRRVRRGDFAGLLGEAEGRVSAEGALGRAFGDEMAALRVALWRLVSSDELEVLEQARAVSEVVGMSVRAAKMQEAARKAGEGEERRQVLALLEVLGPSRT